MRAWAGESRRGCSHQPPVQGSPHSSVARVTPTPPGSAWGQQVDWGMDWVATGSLPRSGTLIQTHAGIKPHTSLLGAPLQGLSASKMVT